MKKSPLPSAVSAARQLNAVSEALQAFSCGSCLTMLRNGVELRAALTADGMVIFFNLKKMATADSNGTWTGISLGIREPEENSGGRCSKELIDYANARGIRMVIKVDIRCNS